MQGLPRPRAQSYGLHWTMVDQDDVDSTTSCLTCLLSALVVVGKGFDLIF